MSFGTNDVTHLRRAKIRYRTAGPHLRCSCRKSGSVSIVSWRFVSFGWHAWHSRVMNAASDPGSLPPRLPSPPCSWCWSCERSESGGEFSSGSQTLARTGWRRSLGPTDANCIQIIRFNFRISDRILKFSFLDNLSIFRKQNLPNIYTEND